MYYGHISSLQMNLPINIFIVVFVFEGVHVLHVAVVEM